MCPLLTHSAPQLQVDAVSGTVSMPCCKGYCGSKASHGVETGCWYFEVKVLRGAVRVGWAQALSEIQGPVGYDEYGYSLSNKHSSLFHCSRAQKCSIDCSAVKVIGCILRLPESERALNDFADAEVVDKMHMQFPPPNFITAYRVRQDVLAAASIEFLVDGQPIAELFTPIYRAKYFPAVSVFGDGAVQVIFDVESFSFPVPPGCKSFQ
jgi:hypothetical protein